MDDPPHSRVFVVCGKAVEVDLLTAAFDQIGPLQNVKLIREKGVAYIKYEKASSAALAVETLHETVLNDGRGPNLKVMLAEAPNARKPSSGYSPETESRADPDNIPPHSRLFLVVPKTADADSIEAIMSHEPDLQYCKTDLISSKGIVFCKFARASSALHVMESISEAGMLAGYKVKCMLAEPKSRRHSPEANSWTSEALQFDFAGRALSSPIGLLRQRTPSSANSAHSLSTMSNGQATSNEVLASTLTSGFGRPIGSAASVRRPMQAAMPGAMPSGYDHIGLAAPNDSPYASMAGQPMPDYTSLQALNGLTSLQAIAALQGAANLAQARPVHPQMPSALDILSASKQAGLGGLGAYSQSPALGPAALHTPSPMSPLAVNPHLFAMEDEPPTPTGSTPTAHALSPHAAGVFPSTRLYVVVSKAVSADILGSIFRTVPGLQFCDLKRDHRTGQSRGFCYVTYSTTEAAAAALERFHAMECPPNSGHRLKVMWAEPQQPRAYSGGTPRLPSSPSGIMADSSDALLQHRAAAEHAAGLTYGDPEPLSPEALDLQTGESPGEGLSLADSLHHRVEVAAVQNSLAHMSMPHLGSDVGTTTPAQIKPPARRQPAGSPDSDADSASASVSGAGVPSPVAGIGPADDHIVYTIIARPLPSYALEHVFSGYGPVEWVKLQRDAHYGMIRFHSSGSAAAAVDGLNGTEVCGQALTVLPTDPLNSVRNKRPRVAE